MLPVVIKVGRWVPNRLRRGGVELVHLDRQVNGRRGGSRCGRHRRRRPLDVLQGWLGLDALLVDEGARGHSQEDAADDAANNNAACGRG